MKRQHKNAPVSDGEEVLCDDIFDALTEAIIDDEKSHDALYEEPFESYIHQLGSKIHKDIPVFRLRFVKGYQVLLETVKHDDKI